MPPTRRKLTPKLIRDFSDHWPLDDTDRMESVCNHLGELDKDLWNKNDMGNWLSTTYVLRQSLSFLDVWEADSRVQLALVGTRSFSSTRTSIWTLRTLSSGPVGSQMCLQNIMEVEKRFLLLTHGNVQSRYLLASS